MDVWAEATTVGDVLLRTAARVPDRPALVTPERAWTYAEVAARAQQFARNLAGLGVQSGGHVGYLMANGLDSFAAVFGIALAGAVAVPINNRYRENELRFLLDDSDVVAVLTNDEVDGYVNYNDLLRSALVHTDSAPAIVLLGGTRADGAIGSEEFDRLGAAVSDEELRRRRELVRLRDLTLLLYTSGTTATPRAALITHEALVRDWGAVADRLSVTGDDRVWNPAPFFHITGIGVVLFSALRGATVLSSSFFEADSSLDLLVNERVTLLYAAYPPITFAVFRHPRFDPACFPEARAMLNIGPPDTMRQMQELLPQAIQISTFGMTETCGPVTLPELADDADTRAETCGRPLRGHEVRIADFATGAPLPAGERGEILVRGVSLCEGYYKDPEKTARSIDAHGWLHCGDVGLIDEGGNLVYLGREKEMLKVGGENVAPAEVESHLSTHPAVHLVQVVGVPDARLDEVPAAFIELRPGHTLSETEVVEYCTGAIARFKIPRYVRFVDEWPMSATKIQKFRLRDALVEELDLG